MCLLKYIDHVLLKFTLVFLSTCDNFARCKPRLCLHVRNVNWHGQPPIFNFNRLLCHASWNVQSDWSVCCVVYFSIQRPQTVALSPSCWNICESEHRGVRIQGSHPTAKHERFLILCAEHIYAMFTLNPSSLHEILCLQGFLVTKKIVYLCNQQ